MAFTGHFPDEIILEIFAYLSCSSLASTSRASHRFHAISQPLLYRAPVLITNPRTQDTLEIFLNSLLTPGREWLAYHVQSLTLQLYRPRAGVGVTPEIATVASRLMINWQPLTAQYTYLVILLNLLPRLRTIDFSPPHSNRGFDQFLRETRLAPPITFHPEGLPIALQSLREFRCIQRDNSHGLTAVALIAFMNLPSIRIIEIHLDTADNSYLSTCTGNPSSNVTDLRLSYEGAIFWSFQTILKIPRALERFSCTVTSDEGYFLPTLKNSLEPLRNSLQSLRLDFTEVTETYNSEDEDEDDLVAHVIKPLRDWPVLRTVMTSLMPLLGMGLWPDSPRLVDVLPVGIRELEILSDHYWSPVETVREVLEMLGEKMVMVPALEKLAVLTAERLKPEARERLRVACDAAGVTLVEDTSSW